MLACTKLADSACDAAPTTALAALRRYDVYLQPWREMAAVGLRGVMASHNMIGGQPLHGSRKMLTEVLRTRFGFGDGCVW